MAAQWGGIGEKTGEPLGSPSAVGNSAAGTSHPIQRRALKTMVLAVTLLLAGLCGAIGQPDIVAGDRVTIVPSFPVDASVTNVRLNDFVSFLVDPQGVLSPREVANTAGFRPFSEMRQAGYSDSVYWFRITIANTSALPLDRWLYADNMTTASAHLYQLSGGEPTDLTPTRIARHVPTFAIHLEPHQEAVFVARLRFNHQMKCDLFFGEGVAFRNEDQSSLVVPLLCYGVFVGLFFYNLFLAFSLRRQR